MDYKPLAVIAFAALAIAAAPATAGAQDKPCCDKAMAGCCAQADKAKMPCCAEHKHPVEQATFFEFDTTLPEPPVAPVRQYAEVWLMRPVKIGDAILQGRYVIEHDTDRQARGEPCTHIYAYGDRDKAVVVFHCLHLERDPAGKYNLVGLYTAPDGMQRLTEFQFAGETAAHGNPFIR